AARLKSEFMAVMSHEMRTPLNAVTGFTDILLDESLSAEQREMLNTIKRSSDGLLDVINDVLDLSKLEANAVEVEGIEFDLEEIAYDAADIARSKVSTQRVEINVDLCDIYSKIVGDSTKIRQILINLLGNAIKFTEEGEVLLKVENLLEDEEYIHLEIKVKDTGIGMTQAQCEKIFKPFQQADSSTTRKYGGTGLGLSISKGLVEAMGGQLLVRSEVGVGTEFFFELRFKKAPKFKGRKRLVIEDSGSTLIVDDNENSRKVLRYHLEKMGLVVEDYGGYDEAVPHIAGKNFDIAFIDLMMPGKDGFEVLKLFKEASLAKRYIAQTAMVRPQLQGRLKESIFDTYLSKPVRPEILNRVVSEVFNTTSENVSDQKESDFEGITLDILIAEDNQINQTLIKKVLRKMGHNVVIVENGQEAVDELQKSKYDIVLMDMLMPVMDGITATEEIRKNKKLKDLPIVAMTANAMNEYKKKCLDAGMNDFVSKPVRREKLWQLFNEYCYEKPLPTYSEQPRVLIIEDDRVIQKIISYFFETKMPTVSWKIASDGVEACTLIGSMKPHLILTDILMPNMDGVEVVKFLRSNDEYKDTSVLVLTTLEDDHEKILELRKLGVIDIFKKPLKNQVLFHTIKNELHATLMDLSVIY
ncbi:MAG: response regulator, partial [Lentisphaeraceae bacterium]|nr:response regulator [Lentisphaeraceae bacterium]